MPLAQYPGKLQPDQDTLGLWHLDDGTGTTAADALGLHALTLVGGAAWSASDLCLSGPNDLPTGLAGNCVALDGTTGYLTAAAGLLDSPPAKFCVGFTFKTLSALAGGTTYHLFSKVWVDSPYSALDAYVLGGRLVARLFIAGVSYAIASKRTAMGLAGVRHRVAVNVYSSNYLELIVDGVREASVAIVATPSGNQRVAAFGAYLDASASNFAPVAIDEIRVLGRLLTYKEATADYYCSRLIPSASPIEKLVRVSGNPVIPGSQYGNSVGEPCVKWTGSQFDVLHNAGQPAALAWETLGAAGAVVTDHGLVLGQGHGGEAGNVYQPCRLDDFDGSLNLYYATGSAGSDLLLAYAGDGLPSSLAKALGIIPLAHNAATWTTQIANVSVVKDGAVYRMLFEALCGDGLWRIGSAKASNRNGPFAPSSAPHLTLARGRGGYGGPCLRRYADGRWVVLYHAAYDGLIPTNIYAAWTRDLDSDAWTQYDNPVLQIYDETFEVDQVADPEWVDTPTGGALFYTGANNGGNLFRIGLAFAKGQTLQQVLEDGQLSPAQLTQADVLAALASANPNAPAAGSAASVLGKFKFTTLGNPLSVPATDAVTPLVIQPLPIGTLLTVIGGNVAYNLTQDGGVGAGGAAITLNGVALTTDSLRVLDANNQPVLNATVQLFLATDTTYTAFIGTTITGVDGRWVGPIKANSGSYTLLISAQGEQVDVVTGLVVP